MEIPCWPELVQYGAGDIIQREYSNYVTQTEQDYAVSLLIDIDTVPPPGGKYSTPCGPPQFRMLATSPAVLPSTENPS